jgi:hypothetical protein
MATIADRAACSDIFFRMLLLLAVVVPSAEHVQRFATTRAVID